MNTYEVYARTNTINKNCNLKSDKRVIQILSAGIATAIDSGSNCTSLIDNVIDLHMTQMKADGFIEQAWNTHLSRVGDASCLAEEGSIAEQQLKGGDEENTSLSFEEMAGIFILHAILSVVALAVSLVRFFLVKKENPEAMLQALGTKTEEEKMQQELGRKGDVGPSRKSSSSTDRSPIVGPNQFWDP